MKFLIDECLSLELARMARERGHGESSHVVWIGRQGIKDWELLELAVKGFIQWKQSLIERTETSENRERGVGLA